jgi:hypothetical protein
VPQSLGGELRDAANAHRTVNHPRETIVGSHESRRWSTAQPALQWRGKGHSERSAITMTITMAILKRISDTVERIFNGGLTIEEKTAMFQKLIDLSVERRLNRAMDYLEAHENDDDTDDDLPDGNDE